MNWIIQPIEDSSTFNDQLELLNFHHSLEDFHILLLLYLKLLMINQSGSSTSEVQLYRKFRCRGISIRTLTQALQNSADERCNPDADPFPCRFAPN